jgi:hypothetical protein
MNRRILRGTEDQRRAAGDVADQTATAAYVLGQDARDGQKNYGNQGKKPVFHS